MPPKNKRHQPSSPTASSATSKRRRADSNSNQALAKTSAAPPEATAPEYPDSNTIHIVASSKIQAKVRAVLTALSSDSSPDANNVVVLQGRAPAANKLITVAEIAKRELEQQQKPWWSYVGVKGVLEELKSKEKQVFTAPQDSEQAEEGETADEEDAFEPPPGQQNRQKVRNVAVMTLYLATKPRPELRALYGEQHSEN
ncbi:hypothetical protein IWZ01DRAFT_538206 [Phyllosticta capitalensis]